MKKLEQKIIDDTYFGVHEKLSDFVTDFAWVHRPVRHGQPRYAEGACFVSSVMAPLSFPVRSFRSEKDSAILSAKIVPEILEKINYRLYEGLGSIEFVPWPEHEMVMVVVCDRICIARVRLGFVPISEFQNLEIKEP